VILELPQSKGEVYAHRLNLNRAVFLDRDGTLIQEKEYLSRPDQVALFPGVGQALRGLGEAGFKLFMVSNQSGVGRGLFTLADVGRVHARLADELAAAGARIDKIYVAPEVPGAPSRGRKPLPQFLFDARDEFQLDLSQCYFIGDKLSDLQCGWNAGVKKSILVRTGYGRELEQTGGGGITAAVVVDDLAAAAAWILQTEERDETIAM
jgi:D-glycero-D-manno-heptose 1,7-bisphosphate phosphatase